MKKKSTSATQIGISKHLTKPLKVHAQNPAVLKEHHINIQDNTEPEDQSPGHVNPFETILMSLTEKIVLLASKFESVMSRVDNIERILAGKASEVNQEEISEINKNCENLSNRLVILETEIISIKQVIFLKNLKNLKNLKILSKLNSN